MNLIIIAALAAATVADKLDRTYLPPPSAKSAGGSPGSLQTPFASNSLNGGLGSLPKGSYTNEFQGVVVDAVAPGTRASGAEETGLGAPRISYGSINSKVGAAAFKTNPSAFGQASVAEGQDTGSIDQGFVNQAPGSVTPDRPRASLDRASNTVKFDSQVGPESYSYSFETDNGISAEENGVATNGVQAQGGFSYTGDDGQVYTVTYTADEGGYQPKGDHLPTPPPIPEEILKSLERNAKDEAAGLVDDGSYDAQKYNTGGDYADNGDTNGKYSHQSSKFGGAGETDVTASGSFINQNNQLGRPGQSSQSAQAFGSGNKVEKYQEQTVPTQGTSRFNGQFGTSQSEQGFGNENKGHNDSDGQSGLTQEKNGFTGHFGTSNFGHRASVSGSSQSYEERSESPVTFGQTDAHAFTQASQGISRPNKNDGQSGFELNRFGQTSSFSYNSNQENRFSNNNEYLPPVNSFGQNGPQNKRPGFQNAPQFNTYAKSETEQSFPTNVPGILSQGSKSAPLSNQKPNANAFSGQFGLQQKQDLTLNQPSNNARPSLSGNTFGQSYDFGNKLQQNQGLTQHQPSDSVRPSSNSDTFGQSQNFGNKLQKNQASTQTETSNNPRPSSSGATFGQTQDFENKLQQNQGLTETQPSQNRRPSSSGAILGQPQGFGNKFSSKNEYLPPSNNFGLNNTPSQKQFNNQFNQQFNANPQFSANLHSSQSQQQESFPNSVSSSVPTQQPSFGFTSQSKLQSNGRPNYQGNNRFNSSPNIGQPQLTASSPGIQTASQQTQPGQFQSQFSAQKATSQPDTELTTPLETSGPQSTHDAYPTASISSRPTQSTFGASASASTGYFPSFSSQSTPRPQKIGYRPFGIRPQPTAFPSEPASSQYQQSKTNGQFGAVSSFSHDNDVQGAPSTPSPTFIQQVQGPDDSYYYRQPSKPFVTPQGSRFPSAPSNQFNIVQKRPQNNQFVAPQQSNLPSQSQSSQFQESSQYPMPPSIAPTISSQSQFQPNYFSNQYSGITQASISPFPSQTPTQPTQFNQQGQFGRPIKPNQTQSRPIFEQISMTQASFSQTTVTPSTQKPERQPIFQSQQSLTNQPEPTESASQQTPTQQYNGELYEYNKPPEVLPAPENNEPSGSAIHGQNKQNKFEAQPSRTQPGQKNDKSQISTTQFAAQSSRPFGASSRPQFGQKIQQSGFGSQSTVQATSQPQFSQNVASTLTQDQSTGQNTPAKSQFGAEVQQSSSSCCQGSQQSDSLPNSLRPLQGFGSQGQAQFGQSSFPGSQGLRPEAAVSSFAGKGEQFGGPRKPPSFDDKTGYHY